MDESEKTSPRSANDRGPKEVKLVPSIRTIVTIAAVALAIVVAYNWTRGRYLKFLP